MTAIPLEIYATHIVHVCDAASALCFALSCRQFYSAYRASKRRVTLRDALCDAAREDSTPVIDFLLPGCGCKLVWDSFLVAIRYGCLAVIQQLRATADFSLQPSWCDKEKWTHPFMMAAAYQQRQAQDLLQTWQHDEFSAWKGTRDGSYIAAEPTTVQSLLENCRLQKTLPAQVLEFVGCSRSATLWRTILDLLEPENVVHVIGGVLWLAAYFPLLLSRATFTERFSVLLRYYAEKFTDRSYCIYIARGLVDNYAVLRDPAFVQSACVLIPEMYAWIANLCGRMAFECRALLDILRHVGNSDNVNAMILRGALQSRRYDFAKRWYYQTKREYCRVQMEHVEEKQRQVLFVWMWEDEYM